MARKLTRITEQEPKSLLLTSYLPLPLWASDDIYQGNDHHDQRSHDHDEPNNEQGGDTHAYSNVVGGSAHLIRLRDRLRGLGQTTTPQPTHQSHPPGVVLTANRGQYRDVGKSVCFSVHGF